MQAVVQDTYGSPDVLEIRDIRVPTPADHEILVRVHAASVNAYDWHVMRGDPKVPARLAMGVRRPRAGVRGRDFAGRVVVAGRAVRDFRPGDEVYGEADGTFAEFVTVPEEMAGHKPANLTFEEAACLPLAANTALIGLRDLGRVGPGQRILINGASGGVGLFAVQIGVWLGAEVIAVCSARNADLVRAAGADLVVDYRTQDFTRAGKQYDVVMDTVGTRTLAALRRALTPAGTLVLAGGGAPGGLFGPIGLIMRAVATSPFVRQRLVALNGPKPRKENLVTLKDLAEAGHIRPVIERTYPLTAVSEAIRYMENEHVRSKIVITNIV